MERATWTDERLNDLSQRVETGFGQVHADIRDLRTELRGQTGSVRSDLGSRIDARSAELGARIDAQGVELGARIDAQGGDIAALRTTLIRVGGGMMVGLVGVIAAVLATGP